MDTNKKYYVVIDGKINGLFLSEEYFKQQIEDYPNAKYMAFPTPGVAALYLDEKLHASKYYVVKNGKEVGVFVDDKVYQEQIQSFKGAVGKSFKKIEDAVAFLIDFNKETADNNEEPKKKKAWSKPKMDVYIDAYVDGSFDKEMQAYSFGVVMLSNDKKIEMSQVFSDPNWLQYGNVAGEVLATTMAVQEAINRGATSITIHHDLEGLSLCLKDDANITASVWKSYRRTIRKLGKEIELNFEHVKAHSGEEYNSLADKLAKKALKNNQRKLKVRETKIRN